MQPGVQGVEPLASPESVLEAGKAEQHRAKGTGSWLVTVNAGPHKLKAQDMKITYATLDDGTSIIVQKHLTYISNPISGEHSNIPLTSILTVGPKFSIQEKMPGLTIGTQWHSLSSAEKHIDSASFDTAGVMSVGSLIAANPTQSSSTDFDNIFEYFVFLITLKQQIVYLMKPRDLPCAEDNLSFVEAKTLSLLGGITDPLLLHYILTHTNLYNSNILTRNNGSITAVLDLNEVSFTKD
ncbi:hypothetical protein BYT27DRAFT_7255180 [Phlegmacium glaucopus]|nr:hypothetical protein BYT27DRAFT_7255180 [Phlegmacium glaucopus]